MSNNGKSRPRKERVIHARIPASLEIEIKRMADRLRIPVSNLVRNILQDTVAMVDGVQQNVEQTLDGLRSSLGRLEHRVEQASHPTADAAPRGAEGGEPAGALARVFGWQEVLLNQAARCARCERPLESGSRALFGMTGNPNDRVFVCPTCREHPGASAS
jgi:hypothetical protein